MFGAITLIGGGQAFETIASACGGRCRNKDNSPTMCSDGTNIFFIAIACDIILLLGLVITGVIASTAAFFPVSCWGFFGPSIGIAALVLAGVARLFLQKPVE